MFNPTPAMAGWFGYPLELDDRLRLIKAAGFQSVLLWWAVESAYEPPVPLKMETAAKHGLAVENAHLQFAVLLTIREFRQFGVVLHIPAYQQVLSIPHLVVTILMVIQLDRNLFHNPQNLGKCT